MSLDSLDSLGLLADMLIEAFDDAVVGASLVRIVTSDDDPGQVEFGIRPLDGHPVDELDGFRAPPSWQVVGVVTGGWAGPMGGGRPSSHPDARRITQVVLIDRVGAIASRVRFPDGSIMRDPPSGGIVLNALRAVLGLHPVRE